ncbi:uncharacterized protein FTOL_13124 [Fusarium torulosum]|jgi:hypothetical protein
MSK